MFLKGRSKNNTYRFQELSSNILVWKKVVGKLDN